MMSERKRVSIGTINLENRIFYCPGNIASELLFEICSNGKNDRPAARETTEIRNKINIHELIEPRR
jgi:hypothetical protein